MPENRPPRLFGTNGIRGVPNRDLTTEFCSNIGKAIGPFLSVPEIVMGTDTRDTRYLIAASTLSGILSQGVSVIDLGILP
ncbi:MAG: phosphoglucosamine mutase, partial [Thermoplasmataceae archaeon]